MRTAAFSSGPDESEQEPSNLDKKRIMIRTRPITLTMTLAVILGASVLSDPAPSQSSVAGPVELGRVQWHRNFEEAVEIVLRADQRTP